ncbi:MAG: tetratricopeptide repeat protein [Deltaproteobacteria bacterium]|nr:tetratricopeptide repeat protein [Deltaproteobacteria bacterium]
MKTDRHHINSIIFLLFFFAMVVLPHNLFAQEEGEEAQRVEDEKMTKEGQAALVAASEALQIEDFATAEKTLVDYLATNPTYKPEILYSMLGVAYFNQDKFNEASKTFGEAFNIFPENTEFLTNQTQCIVNHAQKNDDKQSYIEGAKLFEKCYQVIPGNNTEHLRNAALCYYAAEDLTAAKRVFIQLYGLKTEPDFEILETIYRISEELGQKDEMRKYLYQMMDLKPLKSEYWLLLGQMYYETNDYQNIAATLEIAYDIKTPEKKDLDNLIGLYNYLNVPLRTSKSLVKYSKELEMAKDDKLQIIKGYYSTNRFDKCVSYIDETLSKKKDTDFMIQKATILLESRKNEDAIKAADDIIAVDPNQGNAYMIKGYAAWDMEDWPTAKQAFEKAIGFKDIKSTAKYLVEVIESLETARADLEAAIEEAKANIEGETSFTATE